ncbi:MAG: Rieske 2Fe-2S domain-containing protein [Candidatus Thiodiazotropha sp. (ex. Lucinoma kazani)]
MWIWSLYDEGSRLNVFYGRCAHRGALMSDGRIEGDNIICGVHDWDYGYKSGISAYNPAEKLHRFKAWVEDGKVWVDADEIKAWAEKNPFREPRDCRKGPSWRQGGAPL